MIPYYEKWIKRFPDIVSLSKTPLQTVLSAWQGLGYYQRARNLHAASHLIVDQHQAKMPSDHSTLSQLPGFGPYTTAAVLSIAFDLPYPVLDANVRRLGMRLIRLTEKSPTKTEKKLNELLLILLPRRNAGQYNQALMELGALVCRPQNPACHICPVIDFCAAYTAGEQEIIPPSKKQTIIKISAVVGIIENDGKFLIQKRPLKGLLAGLWEFPGGKIEPGETPEQALKREIREEIGAEILSSEHLQTVKHAYTQFQATLHAYRCQLVALPRLSRDNHRWVTLKGMQRFPFPSGSAKIIRFLQQP